MNKIALRAAIATAAIAPMLVLGAGVAAAGPVVVGEGASGVNPGEVAILEATGSESWNCTLWGPWKVDSATVTPGSLQVVGGFQPGQQVTAACLGDTVPWVTYVSAQAHT